jgi:hypothetical protein
MKRLINRIFQLEEIDGAGQCPTYLYRWTLFSTPWFKIYLHRFVGDDWSRDLHDHPKRFVTIGLRGRYLENTPTGCKVWVAPWFRSFPATHKHRIAILEGETCWTLVAVFKSVRPWGFWANDQWIHWREYVDSERADRMKSCS